uniref:Uncharacterized protein n=1 Tax=Megaselia scalaris TaxID=36166 RepID=T1GDF3_MEGSC
MTIVCDLIVNYLTAGTTTENFRKIRRFRKGDALVMLSANIYNGKIIFNKSNQILAYVDDIELIVRSSNNISS